MNKNLNEHSFVLQLADTPELYDIIERDIFIMIYTNKTSVIIGAVEDQGRLLICDYCFYDCS